MRLSHLNALRALEATLRLGSFAAAAEELSVTPAAVGQRIRSLEDYLGRDLFERSGMAAAPTDEARKVLPLLNTGFSSVADALKELKSDKSSNVLWVTMPESFAENWFARMLSDFTGKNPHAELRLDPSNRDYDLSAETFDFAIRYGKPLGASFEELELFGDSVQPVCSPDFMNRHGLHTGLRDLDRVPLIHVLNRTGDPGWVGFEGWARTFGYDLGAQRHGVRFSKTGSGLQAAIAGQGLIVAGLVEAFHALTSSQLVLPFGSSRRCETTYKYRLVRKRETPASSIQRTFSAWLGDCAQRYRRDVEALLDRTPV